MFLLIVEVYVPMKFISLVDVDIVQLTGQKGERKVIK